jgi:hypothetical protein
LLTKPIDFTCFARRSTRGRDRPDRARLKIDRRAYQYRPHHRCGDRSEQRCGTPALFGVRCARTRKGVDPTGTRLLDPALGFICPLPQSQNLRKVRTTSILHRVRRSLPRCPANTARAGLRGSAAISCQGTGPRADAPATSPAPRDHRSFHSNPTCSTSSNESMGFWNTRTPAKRPGTTVASYPVQKKKGMRCRISSSATG